METFLKVDIVFFFLRFKSYYVVWKLFSSSKIKVQKKVFKLYYVVWKPFSLFIGFLYLLSFKSYYVVWKLILPVSVSRNRQRFKSYYVVWKQFDAGAVEGQTFGLNRTMQYGNKKLFKLRPEKKKFKSYYVVWKQKHII